MQRALTVTNGRNRKEDGEEEFGSLSTEVDDDGLRSIWTIVPHELERVEEKDEKWMAKLEDEEEEERRVRRVKLGRPRNLSP